MLETFPSQSFDSNWRCLTTNGCDFEPALVPIQLAHVRKLRFAKPVNHVDGQLYLLSLVVLSTVDVFDVD